MLIIAKNITENNIVITDLNGITIPANSNITLTDLFTIYKISESNTLLQNISNGNIVINNGSSDLDISDSIRYILTGNAARIESGKLLVHPMTRDMDTENWWSGISDDISDITKLGNGNIFKIRHNINDPIEQSIYFDLNIAENRTFVQEGYIVYKNADMDTASLYIVTRYANVISSTNTNFNSYTIPNVGDILLPANGTGNIELTSDITNPINGLVYIPLNEKGVRTLPCFWNADYNNVTKLFENITPAPYGDGEYNIFINNEAILAKFIDHYIIVGTDINRLCSEDKSELGQGMRIKLSIYTNTEDSDHNWSLGASVRFHRLKNV